MLVDPKQVELNHYESIPHLLTPVITSPRMAANALQNLVKEMEQRYGIMSLARTRSLIELNQARAKRGEAPLPYILCVIDELADLMMVAPADVEDSIIRLAQKARAVGIHLVLATQSPRVDVITGMIKANVPSRIAFAVSSQTDSRVILDQNGAESLLGQGDMLFSPVGSSRLQRIQGAYIDEAQIAKLTDLWRRQGEPELREELLEEVEPETPEGAADEFDPDEDPLLKDAIVLVAEMQTASTSMLQRRLRLGYTRAGRMIDMLERRGVISGYEGSKPRQVLITEADLPRVLAALEAPPASLPRPSATSLLGEMPEIGATLREARMRARIDVSEIEAQTKIRAKYLRALENEEWGLLPGPTFVKSFLRTYAQALGLDGKALVEEYRLHHEHPSEAMLEPIVSTPQSTRRRGRRGIGRGPSRGYMIAVSAIGVVIVRADRAADRRRRLLHEHDRHIDRRRGARHAHRSKHRAQRSRAPAATRSQPPRSWRCRCERPRVVYVCLIGDDGRKLIPGIELQPGESTPTYHARRFEITLGNNSVTMFVDGIAADRAALQPGDRLLDHQGLRPPAAAGRPAADLHVSARRSRTAGPVRAAAPASS